MITFEPMFPEDVLSMDFANLDYKSENFQFVYYSYYFLKHSLDFFTMRSFFVGSLTSDSMIYTNPVLGYLFGKLELKEKLCYHLSALSIAPAYRKFKFGSMLMKMFENNGNEYNAYFIDLFVRKSNVPAISLYKSIGYTVYRVILNYYSSPIEDAYDMRYSLKFDPDNSLMVRGKDIHHSYL